jgi:hypothetical protein
MENCHMNNSTSELEAANVNTSFPLLTTDAASPLFLLDKSQSCPTASVLMAPDEAMFAASSNE